MFGLAGGEWMSAAISGSRYPPPTRRRSHLPEGGSRRRSSMFPALLTSTLSGSWRRPSPGLTAIAQPSAILGGDSAGVRGVADRAGDRCVFPTDEGTAVRAGDMPAFVEQECDRDARYVGCDADHRHSPTRPSPASSKRPSARRPRIRSCAAPSSAQTAVATIVDPRRPRSPSRCRPGGRPSPARVTWRLGWCPNGIGDVRIAGLPGRGRIVHSYADDVMAKYPISSLSALSGRIGAAAAVKADGQLADNPGSVDPVQRSNRPCLGPTIRAIWSVQGAVRHSGFNDAASVLTGDFGVSVP